MAPSLDLLRDGISCRLVAFAILAFLVLFFGP
jgi:hypothetical protein